MLITEMWKSQPGKFFCISTKSRQGTWKDHFFRRSEIRKVKAFVEKNLDKDLYFCPHGFYKNRRLKDYAEMPNLLWADLDEVNPRKIQPMPTIAWQSSPGRYQAIWVLDTTMEESVNRRLTYVIGADKGGWDLTQVLRIPGTQNFKYATTPKVKLLWDDGPEHRLSEIKEILPKADEETEPNLPKAMGIYKRYEKTLPLFTRKHLLQSKKPKKGKRSEILWRLNKEMLEAGMTRSEVLALLVISPWNKFKGRRNGIKQLKRELDKSVQEKLESAPVDVEDAYSNEFLTTSMADVEEANIDWIWYPYLARREITILEGDPGLGKSYLAQIVGAHLVDGKKLPSVKTYKKVKGKVCYFDLENDAGSVTKRRLVDNKCRHLEHYFQEEKFFMIDDDEALEGVYESIQRHKPVLVVFDTLNTYIGKVDTHKASETQQALAEFKEIAKRFNCAVIVVRHLTKNTKGPALYRGQGSIGFTGMARVVVTVGQHPEEEDTRVLAVTKLNVTRRPKALTYYVESLPDTLKYQDRSKIVWGDFVELTSDEIVSVEPVKKTKRSVDVEQFLKDELSDGPMKLAELKRAAEARGISMKMIRRVADELGVVRRTTGFGKNRTAMWVLPK